MSNFIELIKEIYKTNNYPEIKRHPVDAIRANRIYKKLSKQELDAYYNTLLNYPTDEQKEEHRHTATSAVLAQKYPEEFVRELGQLKEKSDQLDGQSKENSIFDMKNNETGIQIGLENPYVRNDVLYDIVMEKIRGDIERKPVIQTPLFITNPPEKNVYGEIYSQK